MGKVYKNKKSSGCSLCKPHKHKRADKLKAKVRDFYDRTDREINSEMQYLLRCRAIEAVEAIQTQSVRTGRDKMTLTEINRVIQDVRTRRSK